MKIFPRISHIYISYLEVVKAIEELQSNNNKAVIADSEITVEICPDQPLNLKSKTSNTSQ